MSRCCYCDEEILTGNSFEHPGICDECYKIEKRATRNFDAYMRCSQKYTELIERFEKLKQAKTEELAKYIYVGIPKCIVNEKVQLLEKAKERIKKLNFYGLSVSTQQSIKVSVCHEIDEMIRELNAQYGEHKISKNAQKEK